MPRKKVGRLQIGDVKLKITEGKGVLAKDNKTPWAPRTLHTTSISKMEAVDLGSLQLPERVGEMKSPIDYSMRNMAMAMMQLFRGDIVELQLIDENNNEMVIRRLKR